MNHPPFQFGKMYSVSFHPAAGPLRSSKHLLVPVGKVSGGRRQAARIEASHTGSVKKGSSQNALFYFLASAFFFLSDLFNVLWTPIRGLAVFSRQSAVFAKEVVSDRPFCQHLCNIMAVFSVYRRKEMNLHRIVFSLPFSFASCDGVCLHAVML